MAETLKTLCGKAAVLEGLPEHPAVKAMLAWNADALTGCQVRSGRADADRCAGDRFVPALRGGEGGRI